MRAGEKLVTQHTSISFTVLYFCVVIVRVSGVSLLLLYLVFFFFDAFTPSTRCTCSLLMMMTNERFQSTRGSCSRHSGLRPLRMILSRRKECLEVGHELDREASATRGGLYPGRGTLRISVP